jgi:hypothetical protein
VIYRQESDQIEAAGSLLGLTDVERQAILELPLGRGLWKVRDRSFVVQHQMHPDELAAFDTNARMRGLDTPGRTESGASGGDAPGVAAVEDASRWPLPAADTGSAARARSF